MARIPNGTYLEINGETGDFYLIYYNGISGYVHKAYVRGDWEY
ncbi:MAG: SH3 domain-containing protein [Selenomonadaceae bacterium]|nr:SH3 domain-containing protein [Selenomonadaceae bacterium]